MGTPELPDGKPTQDYAVVFALFPGDPKFYTLVERVAEVTGEPGPSPVTVAWLEPGVRFYVERRNATAAFSYYRFRHSGFGYDPGEPTAWYRARAVPWNGQIPNAPREALLDLDLILDPLDGTVDIFANGGRQVASIKWDWDLVTFPSDATQVVNTDIDGDALIPDAFTLQSGDTGYVRVQYYTNSGGNGNLLGTLRASVTFVSEVSLSGNQIIFNCDFDLGTPGEGSYWAVGNSLDGSITLNSATPSEGDGIDITFASASKSVTLVQVTDPDDDITKTVSV